MSRRASWLIVLVMALVPLALLAMPTNAQTTYSIPFYDDFSGNTGVQTDAWTVEEGGSDNLWHWLDDENTKISSMYCGGKPGIKVPSPGTGEYADAWWFGDKADWASNSCTYDYTGTRHYGALVSPKIEVQTGASAVELTFDYFRQVEQYTNGGYDKTYVEYRSCISNCSTPSGSGWGNWTLTEFNKDSADPSPDGSGWTTAGPLSIPAPSDYGGSGPWYLQVRFYFDSVDGFANNFLGWEIAWVKIVSAAPEGLTITDTNIPECIAGQSYDYTFHAEGGVPPYVWLARLDDLGTDWEIDPDTGKLTGTCPDQAGTYTFSIEVKDARQAHTPKSFTLVVEQSPSNGDIVFFEEMEDLVQSDSNKWTSGEGLWELNNPDGAVAQNSFSKNLWHPVGKLNDYKYCATPGYASPDSAFYYGWDAKCNYYTQGDENHGSLVFTPDSSHQPIADQDYILGFKYYREVEKYSAGSYDKTQVYVSWDGGSSWGSAVWSLDSTDANSDGGTSAGNGWWYAEIPLIAPTTFSGSGFKVRFLFATMDNFANQNLGWLIDDVKLLGAAAPPTCPCSITTTSLPDGQVGVAYNQTLATTGCTAPLSWSVTSGSLPAGLSLNASTGVISGTPTTAGTSSFTVQVTDGSTPPCSDTQALSITISPAGGAQWCETFEGAPYDHPGWTAGGLWHVVDQATKGPVCANNLNVVPFPSPTHDAWYGQDATCNYNTGAANSGSLVSPNIPVTAGIWNLTFDSYLSAEVLAAYDLANVYVSFDGGAWGAPIWTKAAATYNVWQNVGPVSINVPTGASNMQLKFEFNTVDAIYNNFLGWEVDNICVQPGAGGTGLSASVPLVVSQILNFPNPVKDVNTTTFLVQGQGIAGLDVEIFNLAGTKVFDSGFTKGNQLAWHLQNDEGLIVANGVYLYVVTVKGWDGTEVKSEIHKLVVLR